MPGNVTNDNFTGTLPWSLSTSFTETREWAVLLSEYRDGSSQRVEQVGSSRKKYAFSKRLTPGQMDTLRDFYLAHVGIAFRVYTHRNDFNAGSANFKIMRFEGGWTEEITPGRSNTSVTLVEVA